MHIIWEALNCLPSVMLSVKCHFVNGLYIQTSLAVNCLPATSDRYYHTYAQKWWSGKLFKKKKKSVFFFLLYFHIREVLSHSRECGSWAAFPGGSRMIREGSHVCNCMNEHVRLRDHKWHNSKVSFSITFREQIWWVSMSHIMGRCVLRVLQTGKTRTGLLSYRS